MYCNIEADAVNKLKTKINYSTIKQKPANIYTYANQTLTIDE